MDLKEHLQRNGKTDSWINLANQFQVKGTSKQKSDYVRRLFRKIQKERCLPEPDWSGIEESINSLFSPKNSSTKFIGSQVNYCQTVGPDGKLPPQAEYTLTTTSTFSDINFAETCAKYAAKVDWNDIEDQRRKEWEEFNKWKAGKEVNIERKKDGIVIVLSCLHIPAHDVKALNAILSFCKDYKHLITGFVLLGDTLDLNSLSGHDKGKEVKYTLGYEYKVANEVLNQIDAVLPTNCRKTFIWGNHCARYSTYLNNIDNKKIADALPSPTVALNLKDRGYEVYENWKEDFIKLGQYQLFHGIYCGSNPSKQHLDKLRSGCIFGHTHRTGEYEDSIGHAINVGHLADINNEVFSYVSRIEKQSWSQGFALLHHQGDNYRASLIKLQDSSFFYAGKLYKG